MATFEVSMVIALSYEKAAAILKARTDGKACTAGSPWPVLVSNGKYYSHTASRSDVEDGRDRLSNPERYNFEKLLSLEEAKQWAKVRGIFCPAALPRLASENYGTIGYLLPAEFTPFLVNLTVKKMKADFILILHADGRVEQTPCIDPDRYWRFAKSGNGVEKYDLPRITPKEFQAMLAD